MGFSLRFAFQIEAVGVVNDAVEDRIAEGGIRKAGIPIRNGNLRSDTAIISASVFPDD